MHGQEPEYQDSAKYLGINISTDLSWNSHISKIISTANRNLGFVKRNVKTKYKEIKTLAYNSFVRRHVEYASPIQRKTSRKSRWFSGGLAARWVTNDHSPYSSVSNMLSYLGWRSLENRRYDARLITFYKVVHGLVSIPVPSSVEQPKKYTRRMHPFSFRQIHTSVCYYQ